MEASPRIDFSAPDLELHAAEEVDGYATMQGVYKGQKIRRALLADNGDKCIILLDPDSSTQAAFKNLLCINHDGLVVWTTPLPNTHDAFIEIKLSNDGLIAKSWSGHRLILKPSTGQIIDRKFVK